MEGHGLVLGEAVRGALFQQITVAANQMYLYLLHNARHMSRLSNPDIYMDDPWDQK